MSETKPQPRVIMFTTPTCSFCNAAKNYFRQKGIKFKDVDVSKDPAAARDMVRRSGQQGVPVIDIGGKIVVGFDRPKIDRLLVHLQETFSDVVKTDKTGLSKTAHTRWMISAFANFLPGSTIFRLA